MPRTVVLDPCPQNVQAYTHGYAVVSVDVIRATTSAVTVVAEGGRCFPVPSVEAARSLAAQLPNALLAGEVGGKIPPGFHMNNSPAKLALRRDLTRPVILLSSSGTRLLYETRNCDVAYLACLRNWSYTARHLARHHRRVAVIGAGTRGQIREEDQLCCAWIAGALLGAGYRPENSTTEDIANAWVAQHPEAILKSRSVAYLRRTRQTYDLDFILSHIDDVPLAFVQEEGEVLAISSKRNDLVVRARSNTVVGAVGIGTC